MFDGGEDIVTRVCVLSEQLDWPDTGRVIYSCRVDNNVGWPKSAVP